MKDKIEILKSSFVFSTLSQDELAELSKLVSERNFQQSEFILWEGEPAEWFYVVAEGKVKIVKQSSNGRDFIIAFFGQGEMFGEAAVFENKPYPASAQAATNARVLAIKRDDFISFLGSQPQVAMRIIDVLGGRLRDAQSRLGDLASKRAEQRLANLLIMLSSKLGQTLPFTRQEIADMSGLTVETAIRIMSRLKEGSIIRSSRGKVTIIDEEKLRLLSEGPPRV